MRLTTGALAGLGLMMASFMPAQVAAEAKIYSYAASANYCPAGLQPITISGVICCGTPNQSVSYQQMMTHPVARKKHHHKVHYKRVARPTCLPGTKGCTD